MKKAIFCLNLKGRTQKLMNWVPILASAGQEPLGAEHASLLFAKHVFSVGLFALAEKSLHANSPFVMLADQRHRRLLPASTHINLIEFFRPCPWQD
jgi:hypothetical protein